MATSPRLLLLVVLLLFASAAAPSAAVRLVVGGSKRWAPNVNYTDWADGHEFHVGDWLGIVLAPPSLSLPCAASEGLKPRTPVR
jgi:hypothetical protein